jgi:hypothetical protein
LDTITDEVELVQRTFRQRNINNDSKLTGLLRTCKKLLGDLHGDLDSIHSCIQAKSFGQQKAFPKLLQREITVEDHLRVLRRDQKHISNCLVYLTSIT